MDESEPRAPAADRGRYRSYLVRLWREAPGAPWRCHVHCVATGLERRFAGLAELLAFLEAEAAGEPATAESKPRHRTMPEQGDAYGP